jgi:putative Holliday junction resolvase
VVIGLPLNMDGTEGDQAASARTFGDRLVALGMQVAYEDERLSSWEAGERLNEAGRRPRRESGELDSTAARLILQQYLDARRRTGPPEETE